MALATGRESAAQAELRQLDERLVGWFRLAGGARRGAIGPVEGETITSLIETACDAGVPIVGVLASSGADVAHGVAALHAWGSIARSLATASGVVPIVLVVVGPCVSGPALLLGLADAVVMTDDSFAYVTGPDVVEAHTGISLGDGDAGRKTLGGAAVHTTRSGVASLVVATEEEAIGAASEILSYLPANNMDLPPSWQADDRPDRPCDVAAAAVPESAVVGYDVRKVVEDVVDEATFLELRPMYAPNLVTGLARIDGNAVGVLANQPACVAGTLDIHASQKGARFVQWCDAFGLPLVTFVDTPGFLPGKDLEWRGMIRHGAQLAHAYAAATVPRVAVVLRKAYGGAYIVMDARSMGSDLCLAWSNAEIAVMGAPGAVAVLEGRRLAAVDEPEERERLRRELEDDYERRYCTTTIAAQRGYVDEVIEPAETRSRLAGALRALAHKREKLPRRRHANIPL